MNLCSTPTIPEDVQGDGRWWSQHMHHIAETKEREPDVVFIGDSIIHHLQLRPIWSDLYEPLHCLNFGIPGDRTENVLWRIQNGELNNINPKVIVFLVGTNNITDSPEEIADAVKLIVDETRERQPYANIVVVELLPRGQHPNPLRTRNASVNKYLALKLTGLPRVELVSAERGLIQTDGSISHHDMPDFLHLSDAGYRKAFEAVYDLLLQLLYENEKERDLTPSE